MPQSQDFYNIGAKHIWLPYTQMQNHLSQLEAIKTKGSEIFLKDERILIDGIASWWSAAHGYNNPHIVKSIVKQAKTLPHIMLAGFANEETYKLAYRLSKFCEMDRVFFADSGSVAIEIAMKIAWQFYLNSGVKGKTKFLSFTNSYHGDTSGAMSLADLSSGMHQKFQLHLLENISTPLPQTQNDLNRFEELLKNKQNSLAAIFIEPLIQCAGGMKFHDPKILEQILLIAKKFKILTIVDECATGFYRTGKRFALDHLSKKIRPDIMVVGKALTGGTITLAATLTSNEVFSRFLGDSNESALMHGPTFMGNPLACAAANASLDLFEKYDYEKKVKADEVFLIKKLNACKNNKRVLDVRVLGSVGVVETDFSWPEILKLRMEFIKMGVFLRPFAGCIYLMPALNIDRKRLGILTDSMMEIFRSSREF